MPSVLSGICRDVEINLIQPKCCTNRKEETINE